MKQKIQLLIAALCCCCFTVYAQTADSILANLWAIHNGIKNQSCSNGQIISNRAMNLFLADRIGYYLSSYKDMAFCKNNITFNSGDGIFSLSHNLFQAKGLDEPVRDFMSVGLKTNATNAYAAAFSNKPFTNELGITVKKSWITKPITSTNNCFEKNTMDANREQQLTAMVTIIKQNETAFINSLAAVKKGNITDSNFTKAKEELTAAFYTTLAEEYYRQFAERQYRELAATERFKTIRLHWVNVSFYVPVLLQRFVFAESLAAAAANKRSYPFELSLSHSRFWETKKYGRFLLTMEAMAYANNSVQSRAATAITYPEYKNAGGIDTVALLSRNINSIFIGSDKNLITPAVKLSFVYFPNQSHIGFSSSIEQNLGHYKALNATIGVPVVLIDKTTAPAANFEFRVNCFDISHTVYAGRKLGDNISVSLSLAVPFSKIIY